MSKSEAHVIYEVYSNNSDIHLMNKTYFHLISYLGPFRKCKHWLHFRKHFE